MNIIEKTFEVNGLMNTRQKTDRIILHHADASNCTVEDIDRWHKGNGWSKIGYHFFIDKEGNVYRGREEDKVGAHAEGSNSDSIGICFEGKYEEEEMPEKQVKAGQELIEYLKNKYPSIDIIEKHSDVNSTSCPGKNFKFDEIVNGESNEEESNIEESNSLISTIQSTLNAKYGLSIAVDNIYGNETKKALVKGLQQEFNNQFGSNIAIDGIFGAKTKQACQNVSKGAQGNITWLIQAMLSIKGYNTNGIEGIFGSGTESAVRQFQKDNNISVDGIVGKNTFEKLFK